MGEGGSRAGEGGGGAVEEGGGVSEGGGEAGDGGGGAVGGGVKVTATHDCTECDFCHLLRLLVTEGSPTCCCLGSGRVPLAFVGMVSWWCVCVCAHTYLSSMLDLLTLFGRQWLGSFDCSKQLVSCDINGHFCVIYVNGESSTIRSEIINCVSIRHHFYWSSDQEGVPAIELPLL